MEDFFIQMTNVWGVVIGQSYALGLLMVCFLALSLTFGRG